ncbi:Carnitine monooxygenase oxygenase subunit [Fusarium oxysporum f. sp. albedinis]|nr:Carnitine monooxygenase oxygenase subunit [Fusarium oxysporum f. sp. albedinis]
MKYDIHGSTNQCIDSNCAAARLVVPCLFHENLNAIFVTQWVTPGGDFVGSGWCSSAIRSLGRRSWLHYGLR